MFNRKKDDRPALQGVFAGVFLLAVGCNNGQQVAETDCQQYARLWVEWMDRTPKSSLDMLSLTGSWDRPAEQFYAETLVECMDGIRVKIERDGVFIRGDLAYKADVAKRWAAREGDLDLSGEGVE